MWNSAIVGRFFRRKNSDILRRDILQRNILAQRAELAQLEKRLRGEIIQEERRPPPKPRIHGGNFVSALKESSNVFLRRYKFHERKGDDRVRWMSNKTQAALGITAELVTLPPQQRTARLATLRKYAPACCACPGILARLDGTGGPGIINKILDGGTWQAEPNPGIR